MDLGLTNKVIIVTGGTGILGNAFINGIVEAGGTVGILGRNKTVAEERANHINTNGGKAIAYSFTGNMAKCHAKKGFPIR